VDRRHAKQFSLLYVEKEISEPEGDGSPNWTTKEDRDQKKNIILEIIFGCEAN